MVDGGGNVAAMMAGIVLIVATIIGAFALVRKFVRAFKDKRDNRKAYESQLWRMGYTDDPFADDDATKHHDD